MAVVVNEPVAKVVTVVVEPSGSVMVTVVPPIKPAPDIVTVLPTGPLVGLNVRDDMPGFCADTESEKCGESVSVTDLVLDDVDTVSEKCGESVSVTDLVADVAYTE